MNLHANAKLGLAGRRELVLAIESGDGLVRRFDVDGGGGTVVERHARPVTFGAGPALSRAAGLVATASRGRATVTVEATGAALLELTELGPGIEGTRPEANLSPDGRWLVTSGYEAAAAVWRVPARPLGGTRAECVTAAGAVVVTCDTRGRIELWRPPYAATSRVVTVGGKDLEAMPTASGRAVAVWPRDGGTTSVVDVGSGAVTTYRGGPFAPPAPSPDGRLVFVPGARPRVVDGATGAIIAHIPLGEFGLAVGRFDADARRLLTSHRQENVVRVWDARTGRRIATLGPFASPVDAVAISPDGSRAATGAGQLVQLWRVGKTVPLAAMRDHRDFVEHVEFSADGAFLLSAGADGRARVWDAADGRPVATIPGAVGDVAFGPGPSVLFVARGGTTIMRDCPACVSPAHVRAAAQAALR